MKSLRLQRPEKSSSKKEEDNSFDKESKEFKKITQGESLLSKRWKRDFFIKING